MKRIVKSIKHDVYVVLKTSKTYILFVLLGLISTMALRGLTVGSPWLLKPILSETAFFILLGSVAYLIQPKIRVYHYFMWSLLASVLLFGNYIYYQFYSSYLSFSLLSQLSQVGEVSSSIFFVLKPIAFIYFIYPLVILIVGVRERSITCFKELKEIEKRHRIFFSSLLIASVLLTTFTLSLTSLEVSRLYKQWNRPYLVERLGLYTYHIADGIKNGIAKSTSSLVDYDEALSSVTSYFNDEYPYEIIENEYTGVFEGKNVILIHYESAMTFAMDVKFNDKEVTPVLNQLASEGLFFDNYYAQISSGTSSDTEFTVATSLLPINNGTVSVTHMDRDYVTMQESFRDHGYETMSFHANNGDFWNRDMMHKTLGFNQFFDKDFYEIDEEIGLGLSDLSFYRQTANLLLEEQLTIPGPFYANLITLTNHTPFDEVDKYLGYDVGHMEDTKMGNYFKSLNYADYALGEFIKYLEEKQLLDNTVLVIYGDHDANLSRSDFSDLYNYRKEVIESVEDEVINEDEDGALDDALEEQVENDEIVDDEVESEETLEVVEGDDSSEEETEITDGETDELVDETIDEESEVEYHEYYLSKDDEGYTKVSGTEYYLLEKVPLIIWTKDGVIEPQTVSKPMGMFDLGPTLMNMFNQFRDFTLGKDIFSDEEGFVVFPNGNWLNQNVYYNARKETYTQLQEDLEIDQELLLEHTIKAERMIEISNYIIEQDLSTVSYYKNLIEETDDLEIDEKIDKPNEKDD